MSTALPSVRDHTLRVLYQRFFFSPRYFQVSKRYGVKYVDAKVAMDSVFSSLGKALPEPAPPETKAPPPAKGKKGKDSKKGGIAGAATNL